jgi:hypothetical protein
MSDIETLFGLAIMDTEGNNFLAMPSPQRNDVLVARAKRYDLLALFGKTSFPRIDLVAHVDSPASDVGVREVEGQSFQRW